MGLLVFDEWSTAWFRRRSLLIKNISPWLSFIIEICFVNLASGVRFFPQTLHQHYLLHGDRKPQPEPSCFPALNTQNRPPERTHPCGPEPSEARWLFFHLYGIPGQTAAPDPPCFRRQTRMNGNSNAPTCPVLYYITQASTHWKDYRRPDVANMCRLSLYLQQTGRAVLRNILML